MAMDGIGNDILRQFSPSSGVLRTAPASEARKAPLCCFTLISAASFSVFNKS